MTTAITASCFPTPDLALRSADPVEQARARRFASEQAAAAEAVRCRLARWWEWSPRERMALLCDAHAGLVRWRYELALRAPGRLGTGVALDAERFLATLDTHGPNYDRIGRTGRLRAGATWDAATRTYRGGRETPAYRVMLAYGQAALARFTANGVGGDVLDNVVVLPDGTSLIGNRLVRGSAADGVAQRLVARLAGRGVDVSQVETGGEPLYAISAGDTERATMFRAAIRLLATAERGDVPAWQRARYLLYQAPRTKKGSDAVTRTFLVAVGAVLLERPPTLPQDVDLRCMVLGQRHATSMLGDPA